MMSLNPQISFRDKKGSKKHNEFFSDILPETINKKNII